LVAQACPGFPGGLQQDRRGLGSQAASLPDRPVQLDRDGAGERVVKPWARVRQHCTCAVDRPGEQLGLRRGQASPGPTFLARCQERGTFQEDGRGGVAAM
jgi:hypothetical protein